NRLWARGQQVARLEKYESSPRPAARDGLEQQPYEFWICPASPESKGKATHGKFRKHAFLASQINSSYRAYHHSGLPGVCSTPQDFETHGDPRTRHGSQ